MDWLSFYWNDIISILNLIGLTILGKKAKK